MHFVYLVFTFAKPNSLKPPALQMNLFFVGRKTTFEMKEGNLLRQIFLLGRSLGAVRTKNSVRAYGTIAARMKNEYVRRGDLPHARKLSMCVGRLPVRTKTEYVRRGSSPHARERKLFNYTICHALTL